MFARDRIDDKNWDCYDEEVDKGRCKCGQGRIVEDYFVASHEKVPRVERDFIGLRVRCNNPECPSKKDIK